MRFPLKSVQFFDTFRNQNLLFMPIGQECEVTAKEKKIA